MKKINLALIFLGILTTLCFTFASFFSLRQLLYLVDQQKDIWNQKDVWMTLFSNIQDAEISQREYLITGREDYLEPYEQALQTIKEQIEQIERRSVLFEQTNVIQNLKSLIQLNLSELNDFIDIRQVEGVEAAKTKILGHEGKLFRDRIRSMIDQLLVYQTRMMNQNQQDIQTLVWQTIGLNLFNGMISILFLCLLAYLLNRKTMQEKKSRYDDHHSDAIYRALQDDPKHISITTDAAGIVTNINQGVEKILGYQAGEVVQKFSILNFYDQGSLKDKIGFLASQTDQSHLFDAFIASNRFFLGTDSEWIMKKKNGFLFPCYQSLIALRHESNATPGYLLIALEVSSYKKEEFQKKRAIEDSLFPHIHQALELKESFPWRVLVVDNDPDFRAILAAYLHDLGCQVMMASNGEEAVAIAKSNAIDLITMDMLMAPLNGYDVAQKLQNDPALKNIPIAFISIIAKEIRGKIPGVLAYLDKPITKESVLQLLQKCQAIRNMHLF